MAKKELRDRNDRSSTKQRLPKSNTVEEAEKQQTPASMIIQQAGLDPRLLAPHDVQQLQRTIGNRATGQLLAKDRFSQGSMLKLPSHISKSSGQTVQRHCWEIKNIMLDSFVEGSVEGDMNGHRVEPENPNQVYWRMQETDRPYTGSFFAPVTDNPPDVWKIAEDGIVSQEERSQLAVRHDWVPEWHYLVFYRVTANNRLRPYWGLTKSQADENKVYQGGAYQVVFPPERTAEILATIPVIEQEGEDGEVP